jgi:LuxR family maltose regulon positive regulatory protein
MPATKPQEERMPTSHSSWEGPLLKTKLLVPRGRPDSLARPRLCALIDQGLTRRLTLLSAPAGSGKTTLLTEWLRTETGRTTPLAWVSLEEADNRPGRFWLYVAQALDQLQPGALTEVLAMLGGPQPPPIELTVRLLLNQMAELAQDAVLVLDDYHVITHEAIHRSVALFLEHLPPQLHLMITTRIDPPLPLHRLRARRDLVEVRLKDLRFTPGEVADFLGRATAPPLNERQVALLAERTEGWIAGLQLAALSLEGLADVDRFVEAFAGNHRYIVEYLVEEVLQRQPERLQRFLLETAILDRLSGPLCDAVTAGSDSQAVLESLERRNLFLIALDHQRQWYRYHHLFAEALRARLAQARPGEAERLHLRASQWYEQHGLIEPAVNHALSASAFDRAVDLVAATAEAIWHRGDSGILMGWLQALPEPLVRARPAISLSIAWACLTSGQPDRAEALLKTAEEALTADDPVPVGEALAADGAANSGALGIEAQLHPDRSATAELLGKLLATRANVARVQLNLPAAVTYSQQALALLPATNAAWRGWAVWNLAAAHRWRGELNEALDCFAEAKRLFQSAQDLNGLLRTTVWYAEVLADGGRLPEALAEVEGALATAQAQVGESQPVVSLAHLGVAEMLYERYDLERAQQHLHRALKLSRQGGLLDVTWLTYLSLAFVRQGLGAPDEALACLETADQLAPRVPWALATCASARARILQVQGRIEDATSLARPMESLARDQGAPYQRAARTLAYLKLSQGFAEEALAILAPIAARPGHKSTRLLALLALALRAAGQTERALATLAEALAKAATGGHIAGFMELGQPMAALLALGAPRWEGAVASFAHQLLERFAGPAATLEGRPAPPVGPALDRAGASPARLVDPPSERELEVLTLLAEGASNEAIARRLFITLHTAKKHVTNLLGKLGAANRTEAVAKARALGLLP